MFGGYSGESAGWFNASMAYAPDLSLESFATSRANAAIASLAKPITANCWSRHFAPHRTTLPLSRYSQELSNTIRSPTCGNSNLQAHDMRAWRGRCVLSYQCEAGHVFRASQLTRLTPLWRERHTPRSVPFPCRSLCIKRIRGNNTPSAAR